MEEPGPFDRILQTEPLPQRDRTATFIVAAIVLLGALLLILVLPPISILSDGGEAIVSGPVSAVPRDELPPLPQGFETLSLLYDLSAPESVQRQGRPLLTVMLHAVQDDARNLALYTYRDGDWRRLASATLVQGGRAAQAELPLLPTNVAVLRQTEQARLLLGTLPPGAEPDARAAAVLTTLNVAGLVPVPDGRLAGELAPLPPDPAMLVAPTVSALAPPDAESLNAVLASPELRAAHVRELLDLVRNDNYAGVDLDYRLVDPALGDAFVQLVQELSVALREDGRSLTLTLPLPVQQEGQWDTLGYDWQALAPLVDAIKLPMEPDQGRYYQRTEEALRFLTAQVGGGKLLLQVSPLSREQSVEGIRTLTLTDALTLASAPAAQPDGPVAPEAVLNVFGQNVAKEAGASGLYWDDGARALAFRYPGPGGERTVWIANLFSEAFRLELARRFGLAGIAIEDVSVPAGSANIWPSVQQYAETGEVDLLKPNGELLTPRWAADGGSLESDVGAAVAWRAPADAGTYTLTLVVSDGVVRVGQQLRLAVEAPQAANPP